MTVTKEFQFDDKLHQKLQSIINDTLKNKQIYNKDYQNLKYWLNSKKAKVLNADEDLTSIYQKNKGGIITSIYFDQPDSLLQVSSYIKKINKQIPYVSRDNETILNKFKYAYEKLVPYEELLKTFKNYIIKGRKKVEKTYTPEDLEKLKGLIRSESDNIKILDKIQIVGKPMIEDMVEREMEHARKITELCFDWIEKNNDFNSNIDKHSFFSYRTFRGVYEFCNRNAIKNNSDYYPFLWRTIKDNRNGDGEKPKIWIDENIYAKLEIDYRKTFRLWMYNSLKKAIMKNLIDFISIDNIKLSKSSKGFIITADLLSKDNVIKKFITNCISAGGYNIQRFHYRYIIKIK